MPFEISTRKFLQENFLKFIILLAQLGFKVMDVATLDVSGSLKKSAQEGKEN